LPWVAAVVVGDDVVVVVADAVVVVVVVVVVGQAPTVSPCFSCAFHAWTLTVIEWPDFFFEPVWWQIVTFPLAGTVVDVVVVVGAWLFGLAASAFATRTPAESSTAIAAPDPKTARARFGSMRRLSLMVPLFG
jgi:hypothetical protein